MTNTNPNNLHWKSFQQLVGNSPELADKARFDALQWDRGICNYINCPIHQEENHQQAFRANQDVLNCTEADYTKAQLQFCAKPQDKFRNMTLVVNQDCQLKIDSVGTQYTTCRFVEEGDHLMTGTLYVYLATNMALLELDNGGRMTGKYLGQAGNKATIQYSITK